MIKFLPGFLFILDTLAAVKITDHFVLSNVPGINVLKSVCLISFYLYKISFS